jgi:AcrR family transcriptional regulator
MLSHPSRMSHATSRERLLRAAKRLFAEQGYEQTATSAIARDARTSESQLMRYFGGKVGLLEALLDEGWSGFNVRVERVIAAGGNHPEVILNVLLALVSAFARDNDLAALVLFEGRRLRGDRPRVRLPSGFVSFTDTMRRLIRQAQAAREIAPSLDANATTSSLIGATEALIRDRLVAKAGAGRGFPEREMRRTLEAMLAGFAGHVRTSRARPDKQGRSKRSA